MADLISREAAIKGLLSICPDKTEPGSFDEYGVTVLCGAVDVVIKGLPTVDAIPVEWLRNLCAIAKMEIDDEMFIDWLIQTWQNEQEART